MPTPRPAVTGAAGLPARTVTPFRLKRPGRAQQAASYSGVDVLNDGTDHIDVLTGGVGNGPVLVPFPRKDGPRLPTAHRDNGIGTLHELELELELVKQRA